MQRFQEKRTIKKKTVKIRKMQKNFKKFFKKNLLIMWLQPHFTKYAKKKLKNV